MTERAPEESPRPSLQEAMRRLRLVTAEKSDVLAELREAERLRLELLSEALESLRTDLVMDHDQFPLALSGGETPRFWIDATTHVQMARDRRTYRMVKDTKLGRTTLAETATLSTVAHAVTDYIAERMVLREQALEADWQMERNRRASSAQATPPSSTSALAAEVSAPATETAPVAKTFVPLGSAMPQPEAPASPTATTPPQAPGWAGVVLFIAGAALASGVFLAYGIRSGLVRW
jgi:hypothetical protein